MLDAALPDLRLSDSANIFHARERGDLQHHLQRNLAVRMDVWRNLDVDSNIDILKLSVDQGTDPSTTDPCRERARRYGDAVSDF